MTQMHSALLACALIPSGVPTTATARVTAQEGAVTRRDLSGLWQLNRDLSEDTREKLQSMGGGGGDAGGGGHGPGRHGGFGGIGGGWLAAHAHLEEAILNAPTRFVLTQDDQKVVLTEPDGRVRTLPTHNCKVKVDGQDVRTKWENNRLVSEITVGHAKVIETYERSPSAPQLIVTARMDMRGRQVSVRRVYDAVTKSGDHTPANDGHPPRGHGVGNLSIELRGGLAIVGGTIPPFFAGLTASYWSRDWLRFDASATHLFGGGGGDTHGGNNRDRFYLLVGPRIRTDRLAVGPVRLALAVGLQAGVMSLSEVGLRFGLSPQVTLEKNFHLLRSLSVDLGYAADIPIGGGEAASRVFKSVRFRF